MKRSFLKLSQYQTVETSRDFNGRYYIAYSKGASVFLREPRELRRFLKIPKSIPLREVLDGWIAGLEQADSARIQPKEQEGLSAELLATGFGPEAHLDESDPNYQTRTVI